ncbi:MAG: aminotransferase class I/II-fold pyridoxal phosphate-dependent enzyme [Chitinophagaceae bacterium]|nr:aminotransferase class I/II-fold pyridoxal phosphate-dependent enzyme [Chitinophagaceae bacterium]
MQSKLPNIGTSIFTVMSQLAAKHNAINLGQGFPDFPMSAELIECVNKAMQSGGNQYAHTNGVPLLRERLAEKIKYLYDVNINPETNITITPGGTYAIFCAFSTIIQPGDEVIIFEPAYDSYIPNIVFNGGIVVPIELEFPEYSIPWDKVKAAITPKTKAILVNTPHNPTGRVFTKDDILLLQEIVLSNNLYLISDEVYEHLIYDDKQHETVMKYPDLFARTFVCFSFGKTYHCTGWKLGYCIAPENIMKEYRKVHQFNAFGCDTPKQIAIAEYMTNKEAYLSIGAMYQEKRDYLRGLLDNTKFVRLPSSGSYFESYRYDTISDEPDTVFAERLVREFGIAIVPMSAFYQKSTDHKVIRLCFAKVKQTLDAAAACLQKVH